VGHKKLIQEYQKSAIYAYPCSYEEISCISAMKAQACGCYSVTTDFAALDETSKTGFKVAGKGGTNNEEYTKALVRALNFGGTVNYKPTSWNDVATQWLPEL